MITTLVLFSLLDNAWTSTFKLNIIAIANVSCFDDLPTKIQSFQVCDGILDCPGGEDEDHGLCNFRCDKQGVVLLQDMGEDDLTETDSRLDTPNVKDCVTLCMRTQMCSLVKLSSHSCIKYSSNSYIVLGNNLNLINTSNDPTIQLKSTCDLGCFENYCYHIEPTSTDVACELGSPATVHSEKHLTFFLRYMPLLLLVNEVTFAMTSYKTKIVCFKDFIWGRQRRERFTNVSRFWVFPNQLQNKALANASVINASDSVSGKDVQWSDGSSASEMLQEEEMTEAGTYCVHLKLQREKLYGIHLPVSTYYAVLETIEARECGATDWLMCKRHEFSGKYKLFKSDFELLHMHTPDESTRIFQTAFECGNGSFVSVFAVCDGSADCPDGSDESNCTQTGDSACIGKLECTYGGCVPYSLYCDSINDCPDSSDENCVHECTGSDMRCESGQCVNHLSWCSGKQQCFDGSDEEPGCDERQPWWAQTSTERFSGGVDFCEDNGDIATNKTSCRTFIECGDAKSLRKCSTFTCPCGYVQCPGSYCIKEANVCDGTGDCPLAQDEKDCDDAAKFPVNASNYRCRSSGICLPRSYVCDGNVDCPLGDDERMCIQGVTCPPHCFCHFYEIICTNLDGEELSVTTLKNVPSYTRYLDFSSNNMSGQTLFQLKIPYIAYLNLSNCRIRATASQAFAFLVNLKTLDLSNNYLTEFVEDIGMLNRLQRLSLDRNMASNLSLDSLNCLLDLMYMNVSWNSIGFIKRNTSTGFQKLLVFDASYNSITALKRNVFKGMAKLRILFVHHKFIADVEAETFVDLQNLQVLDLSSNNIYEIDGRMFLGLTSCHTLRLNNNFVQSLKANVFNMFSNLTVLTVAENGVQVVEDYTFRGLYSLEILDISRNNIHNFRADMFHGLIDLQSLKTDAYKFCCLKPKSVTFERCSPQADEFSSCENLMGKESARHLIWDIGIFAVIGNSLSLIYRTIYARTKMKIGYGVFVTNLSISDFMMGIYMLIIAGADSYYYGTYIWDADKWRSGVLCKFAGVLSSISSEASIFFICLITLDRLLVIKYPFGTLKFSTKSAVVAALICWIFAITLAVLPILYTDYFADAYYSTNAVCIALPLTRARPQGWEYSLAVFVFFNFMSFLLIALGQIMIFQEVRSHHLKSVASSKRRADLTVARNLLLVVLTDFLCWVPVSVMGIMALTGYTISGEVYVWAAVFILPVNAALNPFLYTVSAIAKKKDFSPRENEQTQIISMDKKNWKSIWQTANMINISKGTAIMSLHKYMDQNKLNTEHVLFILKSISFQLACLHDAGLYFGKLKAEMINLTISNDNIQSVMVNSLPAPIAKDEDKMQDILQHGLLGRSLLSQLKTEVKRATLLNE